MSATALGRLIESLLYEVTTTDAMTLAVAAGVLLAAATLASVLPARKAMKLAPMEALRCE